VTYPEPRYLGDTGEVIATYRKAGHVPELTYPTGNAVHYLATGTSTHGQFGMYRWDMAAARSGPEPHFHRTISESFFILSGTVALYDGRQWTDGKPGDFLFVPEGGVHAFRNVSGEAASMLILFAPGAPREAYFETTAQMAGGLALSDEEKTRFYLRHDTFWLPAS
jgi:mannose-6-phosphate isomerase-like protein (cupin superfamily)